MDYKFHKKPKKTLIKLNQKAMCEGDDCLAVVLKVSMKIHRKSGKKFYVVPENIFLEGLKSFMAMENDSQKSKKQLEVSGTSEKSRAFNFQHFSKFRNSICKMNSADFEKICSVQLCNTLLAGKATYLHQVTRNRICRCSVELCDETVSPNSNLRHSETKKTICK
ncbi:Protein CBG26710 [Caenorhabditis briggsae]|uniref:Protein CBG26710 n=1 Tax=Caenorhabditis briggsae TaxID=6238 RepID=B6IE79_CAEBR|nr:Protein CBG26710 [Caenorhabditis briggsae]CAS01143.1 Protein CBG26710 [Caenorhabditis briggsae]